MRIVVALAKVHIAQIVEKTDQPLPRLAAAMTPFVTAPLLLVSSWLSYRTSDEQKRVVYLVR